MASALPLLVSGAPLFAQAVVPQEGPGIGSVARDRARTMRLLGRDSVRAMVAPLGFCTGLPTSELRIVANSNLPFTMNDGSLWAGRGFNMSLTPAGALTYRDSDVVVSLILAPTITYSQNRPFQIFPGQDPTRSPFSSPWHMAPSSMDLPLRFGDESIRTFDFGESSIRLAARGWTVGAGVQNEWWGPGIRTTLLMSNNPPGIPHLFLQPTKPIQSGIGWFDGRLIVGTLTKSPFFDTLTSSNYRALSGALLTFRPSSDTGLMVGVSRVVYTPISAAASSLGHVADVFTRWEPIARPTDTLPDGTTRQRTDQLTSLFARWEFPESGFEVYGELARGELPRSLHDWIVAPEHTLGYLLGTQLVRPTHAPGSFVRLQAELLYLEQSIAFADRLPPDFYAGRATRHGYTQRGQLIGAGTGPGSSSQFVAVDYLANDWQAGAFVGRIRWENNAMYRIPEPRATKHDVTIYSGLRGAVRSAMADVFAELTIGRRLNYLFQNEAILLGEESPFAGNVSNVTLAITVTSRSR
jgi:hypothetical protein